MTIAKHLKSERKAQGTCIWDFAIRAGIRARAQSSYERGGRCPQADYLNVLHHLEVDVSYILLGVRTKPESTPRRKTFH